ncbi:MAG TPA: aldehyde dehydrogenase, partial [Acidimicrobiaceae bacterium]|nr:aldehyde dehydrogenase [Acidimicrobiaceae bacterium]
AGCPVVLKPADKTPLSAIRLGELLLDECGLPPGWLNVVPCYGPTAAHLAEHPDVAMITFTGSAAVGWQIRANAPRKRVSLELGNNSPVIIEPDTDIATTAARIKGAAFGFTGQVCISTQRIYVHEDIATEFTKALVAETDSLVIGDPADEATEISALINSDATERIVTWISEAVAAGVVIECGGEVGDNGILSPTVLSGITADMKVSCAEVFGPVVGIATYTDFEDALARANDTIYGLHAAVFTKDIAKALRAADVLDFAGVLVNEVPTWRADHMPYGGIRESGNTREGPVYAVQEMTEERLIVIQA